MILYSPFSSVDVVRTFSIRAGLDASTTTPGSTPPDVSLTTPAMAPALVPWANARLGVSHSAATIAKPTLDVRFIRLIPPATLRVRAKRSKLRANVGGATRRIIRKGLLRRQGGISTHAISAAAAPVDGLLCAPRIALGDGRNRGD